MKNRLIVLCMVTLLSMSILSACGKNAETEDVISVEEALEKSQADKAEKTVDESSLDNEDGSATYASLDEEMLAIEDKQAKHDATLSDDATQSDMNYHSAESLKLWDDELNSLWSRFSDSADEDLKNTVLAEQREWIKMKEEKVKESGLEFEGGSIQPLIENTTATEYTRVRCYELAAYLAQATGTEFTLAIPEVDNGDLTFVDRQGTSDIYSKLTMVFQVEGCDATIYLHKLASLEGEAHRQSDDVYSYSDNTLDIEGIIRIDGDSASFEITKSNESLFNVGDKFSFPEKY